MIINFHADQSRKFLQMPIKCPSLVGIGKKSIQSAHYLRPLSLWHYTHRHSSCLSLPVSPQGVTEDLLDSAVKLHLDKTAIKMQIASSSLPAAIPALLFCLCLSVLIYLSYPYIYHTMTQYSFFLYIVITENTCKTCMHLCVCVCVCVRARGKATEWIIKYCSRGAIIYVPPISFFIGLTVTIVWIFCLTTYRGQGHVCIRR